MIIHHTDYDKVDFTKYKRIFIFGCSFTNYFSWPTWANILSLECTQLPEIFNIGQTGGGNLFISATVTAASLHYKFTKDDLVLLMWSTHCREDRYRDTGWTTPGNIWTQNIISEEFVKEWACPKGYIVRDLALMTMTKSYLMSQPCDAILLKSVEPTYDRRLFTGPGYEDVLTLYREMILDYAPPLYSSVHDGRGGWINGHEYYWPGVGGSSNDKKFSDYHPNPDMYMDYLTSIGFKLSDNTVQTVHEMTRQLKSIDQYSELRKWRNGILQRLVPKNIDNPHII